ncbi:peptidase inhibitor I9, partial [Cercophora newfieldiana]
VSCKEDASDEQVKAAKEDAKKQGGTIGYEYTLTKSFQVMFPEDRITTFEKHEAVQEIEEDKKVSIQ